MIRNLHLQNFTVFEDAELQFGALNIVHGANSTGKTHLLKLLYALLSSLTPRANTNAGAAPTKAALEVGFAAELSEVFRPDEGKIGRIASRVQGNTAARITSAIDDLGVIDLEFSTQSSKAVKIRQLPTRWGERLPVYLPTRELLSVYPGFQSLYETQAIPFDKTWRDTCTLLGANVARGPKVKAVAALLAPLEEAIGCKAVLEGGRFYVLMEEPPARVEADLVAEGLRKLSMVARLIANGSLDGRGCMLWDEPEANLNPRLIREVAPLLIKLAAAGVQIFVATHSLFLLREFEIGLAGRTPALHTRFFGLHRRERAVTVEQGPSVYDSGDIAALDESLSQSDRFMSSGA